MLIPPDPFALGAFLPILGLACGLRAACEHVQETGVSPRDHAAPVGDSYTDIDSSQTMKYARYGSVTEIYDSKDDQ
ncbi:hypothetical protein D3C85_1814350 [compost metagenome]